MTVTFDDGRVRLELKPSEVLETRKVWELFDAVSNRLIDMGVECEAFSLSLVVDYLDKDYHA